MPPATTARPTTARCQAPSRLGTLATATVTRLVFTLETTRVPPPEASRAAGSQTAFRKVDHDHVLDAGLANQGLGGYLQSSDGLARSSQGWTLDGTPLDPARTYVVGTTDFLMTGRESRLEFLTRTASGVGAVEERRDIRRAVIEELQRTYR